MRFTEMLLKLIYLGTAGVLLIGGLWTEITLETASSTSRVSYALYVNFTLVYLALGFTYKTRLCSTKS